MNLPTERQLSQLEDNAQKKKTERRHGACNPCKKSKTKCDGARPCGACRSEKRKSRACEYSEKAQGIAAAREEGEAKRRDRDSRSVASDGSDQYTDQAQPQDVLECPAQSSTTGTRPLALMNRPVLLCGVIEEFIKMKSTKTKAMQSIKRAQTRWDELKKLITAEKMMNVLSTPDSNGNISASRPKSEAMADVWTFKLEQILDQVNHGNLVAARTEIPSVLCAVQAWEMYANAPLEYSAFPPTEAVLEQINAIWFQLHELESGLVFVVGPSSGAWEKSQFRLSKLEYCRRKDAQTASKIELYSAMQRMLEIDTSNEEGIYRFLRFCRDIKASMPATPLEEMATCTTDNDPAEKQELRLISNLVFVAMYCRLGTISAHYSGDDCVVPPLNNGPSDIIHDMRMQLPREKNQNGDQANKHAGNALQAFKKLCEIDPDGTAKSWIRLHGALIAAILTAIWGLRGKAEKWDEVKPELIRIEKLFNELQPKNPTNPVFDHAIKILQDCDQKRGTVVSVSRRLSKPNLKRSNSTSSSDDSSIDYYDALPLTSPPERRAQGRPLKRTRGTINGTSSSTRRKRRKLLHSQTIDVPITPAFPQQDITPGPSSYMTEYMHPIEVPFQCASYQDFDPNASFTSSTSTNFADIVPAQQALADDGAQVPVGHYPRENPLQQTRCHPPMLYDPDLVSPNDEQYSLQRMNPQHRNGTSQSYAQQTMPTHSSYQLHPPSRPLFSHTPEVMAHVSLGNIRPDPSQAMPGVNHMYADGGHFHDTSLHEITDSEVRTGSIVQRHPGMYPDPPHLQSPTGPHGTWESIQHTHAISAGSTPFFNGLSHPMLIRRSSESALEHPDYCGFSTHSQMHPPHHEHAHYEHNLEYSQPAGYAPFWPGANGTA